MIRSEPSLILNVGASIKGLLLILSTELIRSSCISRNFFVLIFICWVMMRVMSIKDTGIRWRQAGRPGFCICYRPVGKFLEGNEGSNRQNTKEAAKLGLNTNPEKTKIMKVGRDETELTMKRLWLMAERWNRWRPFVTLLSCIKLFAHVFE